MAAHRLTFRNIPYDQLVKGISAQCVDCLVYFKDATRTYATPCVPRPAPIPDPSEVRA